ncbi:hypothetical protein NTE_00348 [Candidatus Nitrososphaera evergladensis SR1]|uniref:Uncharacterized protein n=1 Tax=Candidatus Nitrososphaera evergladensis SR1 TaxID=1459636 RepID=A0A075MMQ1_9ARCH|nr:hypothetical protein NTE_00348 [Candidatus Nitrososphaera evergladensis SR1]
MTVNTFSILTIEHFDMSPAPLLALDIAAKNARKGAGTYQLLDLFRITN